MSASHLVTGSPALGDNLGHLVDLSLGTAEGTESLLGQLSRTLVLGVTKEFDDAALVWGKAGEEVVLVCDNPKFSAGVS